MNNTWIVKHKEKFITCWTDIIMHFGNKSTNKYAFTISCNFQKHIYYIILLTSNLFTYLLSYLFRAESAHAKLKRYLGSSLQNFETSWSKIHALLELQHTETKASFGNSINVILHNFKSFQFKFLRGVVSIAVLNKILEE